MRRVYEAATKVVVWFGLANDSSDLAIDMILKSVFPQGENERNCINELLHRPWFRRVWVVQEFVVARHVDVMCGLKRVPASRSPSLRSPMVLTHILLRTYMGLAHISSGRRAF